MCLTDDVKYYEHKINKVPMKVRALYERKSALKYRELKSEEDYRKYAKGLDKYYIENHKGVKLVQVLDESYNYLKWAGILGIDKETLYGIIYHTVKNEGMHKYLYENIVSQAPIGMSLCMMMEYECKICKDVYMNGNPLVPVICPNCVKEKDYVYELKLLLKGKNLIEW